MPAERGKSRAASPEVLVISDDDGPGNSSNLMRESDAETLDISALFPKAGRVKRAKPEQDSDDDMAVGFTRRSLLKRGKERLVDMIFDLTKKLETADEYHQELADSKRWRLADENRELKESLHETSVELAEIAPKYKKLKTFFDTLLDDLIGIRDDMAEYRRRGTFSHEFVDEADAQIEAHQATVKQLLKEV